MNRESATFTCPDCRRVSRCLADEYGDHGCSCGWEPEPPQRSKEEQEHSLIGWLERRALTATCVGSIREYISRFERMWAEEFGTDAEIPQDLKDRVNERTRTIKGAAGNG